MEIDRISRIRSTDGNWNFYDSEDIENGQLVFQEVKKVFFDQSGYIPNDRINSFEANRDDNGGFRFEIYADSVTEAGDNFEVKLTILAQAFALRAPQRPDVLILE